jgi:hypothetical protein
MSLMEQFYNEATERYRRCCGGLATDKSHYYFHGKHFNFTYPKDYPHPTSVEGGFVFRPAGACCYYIFDAETFSESFEYGPDQDGSLIPYDTPDFWHQLDALMDRAAEVAWSSDVCSCPECGYNYHAGNEPCHPDAYDKEED